MHTCFKMCVSPPSRSFLNWRIVSQLHLSPISPHSRLKMSISTQSRSHINPIQVERFVSLSAQAPRFTFLLCRSWILPQSGSWYLHLTYIQVTSPLHLRSTKLHLSSIQASSQTHTGFKMSVSPPSGSFLNWRIVSQLHPCPISPFPRLKMRISTQSKSHINPIQVSRFVSPLNPGSQIRVSSLSQLNLTSIWVLIFASRLHPGNISPPASSTKLHPSSI